MSESSASAGPLPLTNRTVLIRAWQDFSQAWNELVVYELLFHLLKTWLLLPAVAVVLSRVPGMWLSAILTS